MATSKSAFSTRGHSQAIYRSGLEEKIALQLEAKGLPVVFEQYTIKYLVPERVASYTPDFLLTNNIVIESKGIFDVSDRKKHLLLKEQFPEMDLRFVFSSSRSKLYKGSKTTYGAWCDKYGFKYADKLIPIEWLQEKGSLSPIGALIAKATTGVKA
jgi:hypothetical protein